MEDSKLVIYWLKGCKAKGDSLSGVVKIYGIFSPNAFKMIKGDTCRNGWIYEHFVMLNIYIIHMKLVKKVRN